MPLAYCTVYGFTLWTVANMSKPPKEKATPTKKPLNQTTKPKHSIEQARAHLLGCCLCNAAYIDHLPPAIGFNHYGRFTLAMIKHGMGIEAITSHLETYGLSNAKDIFQYALKIVPDNADLSRVFSNALRVVCSHDC